MRSRFLPYLWPALAAVLSWGWWAVPAPGAGEGNPLAAGPAPFAGTFAGDQLAVEFSESGATYSGTIKLAGKSFPATGHPTATGLEGSFQAGGKPFPFTAVLEGDTLTLVSGGTTYAMKRVANPPNPPAAPVNPLAAPVNPLAAPADPPAAPARTPPQGGAGAAGGGPRGTAATAPSAGTLVFTKKTVADPVLHCDAYTILVPEGWSVGGSPLWNPWRTVPQMVFEGVGIQNRVGMSHYPVPYFHSEVGARPASGAGRPGAGPMGVDERALVLLPIVATPEEYLRQHVLKADGIFGDQRPEIVNPKVLSATDLTDVAARATPPPAGGGLKSTRVRLEYDAKGTTLDEDFFCTLVWLNAPSTRPGQVQVWTCVCESYAAPKGELDRMMPVFAFINHSRTFNEHWFAGVTAQKQYWWQNYRNFVRAQLNEQAMQVAIQAASNKATSDTLRAAFHDQQAAYDKSNTAFRRYVGDVDPYRNPFGGGTVEVPGGFSHAFANDRGEVILTNDHAYEPPKDASTEWKPLEKSP